MGSPLSGGRIGPEPIAVVQLLDHPFVTEPPLPAHRTAQTDRPVVYPVDDQYRSIEVNTIDGRPGHLMGRPARERSFLGTFQTGCNLFPRIFLLEERGFLPAAGIEPLRGAGGGGRRALLRSSFTPAKTPIATFHGACLPTDVGFCLRSLRCSQSPTTTAPAPRHALVDFTTWLLMVWTCVSWGALARIIKGTMTGSADASGTTRTFRTPRGRAGRPLGAVTGLSLAGRWWSGLRPDAPLLRCAVPPTPWRSAAKDSRLRRDLCLPLPRPTPPRAPATFGGRW